METYMCSCDCGDVKLTFQMDDINHSKQVTDHCNCAICLKQRDWCIRIDNPDHIKLVSHQNTQSLYHLGTNEIDHYLCKICGVKVYSHCKVPNVGEFYTVSVPCIVHSLSREQQTRCTSLSPTSCPANVGMSFHHNMGSFPSEISNYL
ncbi:hypothetical protein SAMD00019534_037240, partial [Acytostelium subglobosum LB1]|uniref:hypothetical protein n=1 Tax=Acytostelium subglobosum LB1 TaxID=1410327 RepID=UPI000644B89B